MTSVEVKADSEWTGSFAYSNHIHAYLIQFYPLRSLHIDKKSPLIFLNILYIYRESDSLLTLTLVKVAIHVGHPISNDIMI